MNTTALSTAGIVGVTALSTAKTTLEVKQIPAPGKTLLTIVSQQRNTTTALQAASANSMTIIGSGATGAPGRDGEGLNNFTADPLALYILAKA